MHRVADGIAEGDWRVGLFVVDRGRPAGHVVIANHGHVGRKRNRYLRQGLRVVYQRYSVAVATGDHREAAVLPNSLKQGLRDSVRGGACRIRQCYVPRGDPVVVDVELEGSTDHGSRSAGILVAENGYPDSLQIGHAAGRAGDQYRTGVELERLAVDRERVAVKDHFHAQGVQNDVGAGIELKPLAIDLEPFTVLDIHVGVCAVGAHRMARQVRCARLGHLAHGERGRGEQPAQRYLVPADRVGAAAVCRGVRVVVGNPAGVENVHQVLPLVVVRFERRIFPGVPYGVHVPAVVVPVVNHGLELDAVVGSHAQGCWGRRVHLVEDDSRAGGRDGNASVASVELPEIRVLAAVIRCPAGSTGGQ